MPTDRLARLRSWPSGVYTDVLARRWRTDHPLRTDRLAAPVAARTTGRRVATVCHVYYVDLLDEVADAVNALPEDSDLYVSVVDEAGRSAVLARFGDRTTGALDVRIVENRGRDIAPKYVAFADVYKRGYDLLLFLHTKKSSYEDGTGTPWRRYLFESLAGSAARVDGVIALFDEDPGLGVLAPDHFEAIAADTVWQGTFLQASRLARRMGLRVVRWAPPDFASGSMFWARPAALSAVTGLRLRLSDFPPEARQVTATNMHALERLLFVAAARAGFRSALLLGPGIPAEVAPPSPVAEGTSPSIRMRVGALGPTVRRMAADVDIRRRRFSPRRTLPILVHRIVALRSNRAV